jgi:hypothetical protein
MAEDVKIYVSETVERVEIKVSDPFPTRMLPTGTLEINDIKANTLSSAETGGSIPPEIYSWFKDKFALLVDKLLSSWVHGLIFITKAIDEALTYLQSTVSEHATSLEVIAGRLDAIDDNLIVSYTVPVDAASIVIDKDRHGNPLNLTDGKYEICRYSLVGANVGITGTCTIFINNLNTSGAYLQNINTSGYNGINARGGNRYFFNIHTLLISIGGIYWSTIHNGTNNDTTAPVSYGMQGFSIKSVVTINSIYKLEFKDELGTVNIKAGTIITIRRK